MNIFLRRNIPFISIVCISSAALVSINYALAQTGQLSSTISEQANTTFNGAKKRTVTIDKDVVYIPDEKRLVDILPEGKDLTQNPLKYHFVLSKTRIDGQLTIRFPDHREDGFICSSKGGPTLNDIILNKQKNFFDKILHLSYQQSYKSFMADGRSQKQKADAEREILRTLNAQPGDVDVNFHGTTVTGYKTTLCMSGIKNDSANPITTQTINACTALLAKLEKDYPKKINKTILGFDTYGFTPYEWEMGGLKTYIAKLNAGGFNRNIFPGGYDSMPAFDIDPTTCYTKYEVLDALKKYKNWEKEQYVKARQWFNSIVKGLDHTKDPWSKD